MRWPGRSLPSQGPGETSGSGGDEPTNGKGGSFMGDMADMFLEQVEDMEELRLDYRTGQMSDFEAYELGIIDEQGAYTGPSYGRDRSRTCRCCGKGGLLWGKVDGKFRLFENGSVHDCPVNPLIVGERDGSD